MRAPLGSSHSFDGAVRARGRRETISARRAHRQRRRAARLRDVPPFVSLAGVVRCYFAKEVAPVFMSTSTVLVAIVPFDAGSKLNVHTIALAFVSVADLGTKVTNPVT
jgi:hypothetical protein